MYERRLFIWTTDSALTLLNTVSLSAPIDTWFFIIRNIQFVNAEWLFPATAVPDSEDGVHTYSELVSKP